MSKQRFYTSVVKLKSTICERFVEDGVRKTISKDFKPELFVLANNDNPSPFTSLAGQKLERMEFANTYDMEDFVERMKGIPNYKLYGSESPIVQYISQRYPEVRIDFDINLIRGAVIDIEVESGDRLEDGSIVRGPFPDPALADHPVTAITNYATHLRKFLVYGLEVFKGHRIGTFDINKLHSDVKKSIEEGIEIEYRGFETEQDLLKAYIRDCVQEEFDYISGWYSNAFDIPYLCNRIVKLLGKEWLDKLSPFGMVRKRTFNSKFGEEVSFNIYGVSGLDMQEIIDKHGFIELDNKKLNTAAIHFLKQEKLSFGDNSNLTEFYFNDYQNYISYNIHDVNLVRRIDQKLKFIQLMYILSFLYHCNVDDTNATVQPWTHLMYSTAARENSFAELRNRVIGKPDYVGGYVKDVVPGRYKWVMSVDANALYPHLAQQFNMGIETIVPPHLSTRIIDFMIAELDAIPLEERTEVTNMYSKMLRNNEPLWDVYWKTPYEFQCLKRLKVCMAPNLAFFRIEKPSLLRRIFKYLYDTRKVIKKEMLKKEQELVNVTAEQDALKLKTEIENLQGQIDALDIQIESLKDSVAYANNNQHGHKIAANAGYGAIANENFVDHFDIRIAEAITSGGQVSTRTIMRRLDEWINSTYNLTGQHVFYGDTDSVYCSFDAVVTAVGYADKTDEEVVEFLDKLASDVLEPLFIEWAEELARSYNCDMNGLFFKREAIAKSAIFTAKKCYAMLVLDNEGVRYAKPKLKVVGLASRKSNYPTFCRRWLEGCYEYCLKDNQEGLFDFVEKCKAEFMAREPNTLGAAGNINDIEKFLLLDFGWMKGTPYNVKGAINHNKMLNFLNITHIKPLISGNKYFTLPLRKGAPFGMEVIAFDENLPVEMKLDSHIDKDQAFEKAFLSPLRIFLNSIGWEPFRPTTNSIFDLF